MLKEMSTGSVSPESRRMLQYKVFAVGFSYPDEEFFKTFPERKKEKKSLVSEYDHLFRAKDIWLYGTEYLAENEFQKANLLSDIMGFYQAFGLEPACDRPDFLGSEFEFMHYLIFKSVYASLGNDDPDSSQKASICETAQKKFFDEYVYPSAKKMAEAVLAAAGEKSFYRSLTLDLLDFLEKETKYLREKL